MSRKKLSTWAAERGVHYRTALGWVRDGIMPVPTERTPGGHIRVIEAASPAKVVTRTVLYARVILRPEGRFSEAGGSVANVRSRKRL